MYRAYSIYTCDEMFFYCMIDTNHFDVIFVFLKDIKTIKSFSRKAAKQISRKEVSLYTSYFNEKICFPPGRNDD